VLLQLLLLLLSLLLYGGALLVTHQPVDNHSKANVSRV
jgi:hypothetical protein